MTYKDFMCIQKKTSLFSISLKFSYDKNNIENEFRYSRPGFCFDWSKDTEIPEEVKEDIGKQNTKKLQIFVDKNLFEE